MVWYNAGTVTVTNGSTVVTASAGVDFISNVNARDGFALTGGSLNEIATIDSKTQLTLSRPWLGATAGGQGYTIIPTTGFPVDLALSASAMLASYAAVRDGIGQGLVPGGTLAAPGLRFAADQDTGLRSVGANTLSLVTGGTDRLTIDAAGTLSGGRVLRLTGDGPSNGDSAAEIQFLDSSAGHNWNVRMHDYSFGGQFIISKGTFGSNTSNYFAISPDGNVSVGTITPTFVPNGRCVEIKDASGAASRLLLNVAGSKLLGIEADNGGNLSFQDRTAGTERARLDAAGNLLVGVTSSASYGNGHRISRVAAEGSVILSIDANNAIFAGGFFAVAGSGYNSAATAFSLGRNSTTGRSINAGGTINASGADYAEYMAKAPGCGLIAKGDVCGVDDAGQLTRSWADAILFKVKSTDPNLVGGDTYSAHLGERPAVSLLELPTYDGPPKPVAPIAPVAPLLATDRPVEPTRDDGEEEIDFIRRMAAFLVDDAAWIANQDASTGYTLAMQAYEAAMATYAADLPVYAAARAAHDAAVAEAEAAHDAALAQYEVDLAAFEHALETARLGVDRIAYCGRVPVNFADPCEPGDYLVAIANGGGIGLKAVAEADITFADYRRRVGRVLSIGAEGRPIVDVAQG